MKKVISLILSVILVACLAAVVVSAMDPDIGDNRAITIYKTATAPVMDGKVSDGEYGMPITSWPGDTVMQSRGDYPENMTADIYMTYDAENIYYAVVTECDEPHVAYVDASIQGQEHWIFNAHYVMSLIIPDDPTKEIYPAKDKYDWSTVYNGGYAYEWTLIYNSKTNAPEGADHFNGPGTGLIAAGAKYSTSSANGYDTYEIAIPWTLMKSVVQPEALTGEEGTIFGFDCMIGLTDVGTGYDDGTLGNNIFFAGCYPEDNVKDLPGCAIITCGGDMPTDESSAPASSDAPAESSKPSTEPTSDTGVIALAVIAVLAVAGAVVVKKVR